MPFELKNAPTIFSRVVVILFNEFIHKFLEVYFDNWIVFGLVKGHVSSLFLIMGTCQKYQTSLNLKKWIFYVPYGIILGHVMCKKGLMVYPTKIVVIINLEPRNNVKQLHVTLGHIRYYKKFIKVYALITVPMEKILKKDATFCWDDDFQKSLDVLKEKMVTMPS